MIEFKLPSLGADMDEGTLLEWKLKPGDTVKGGQVVAVVDTTNTAVDVESWRPHLAGFLIRELSTIASNWRADSTLESYLAKFEIPAVEGIDTRSLTKILRVRGAMKS